MVNLKKKMFQHFRGWETPKKLARQQASTCGGHELARHQLEIRSRQ